MVVGRGVLVLGTAPVGEGVDCPTHVHGEEVKVPLVLLCDLNDPHPVFLQFPARSR